MREQQLQIVEQQSRSTVENSSNVIVMEKQKIQDSPPKINFCIVLKFLVSIGVLIGVLVYVWKPKQQQISTGGGVTSRFIKEGAVELNQTINKKYAMIRQKLDHFNPADDRVFYQRVFITNEAVNLKSSPSVFLYVPELEPISYAQKSNFMMNQANQRRSISLALEMRYFGESQPFEDDSYTLANLKYLTLEQMVEDIAYFIHRVVDNRFFGITERNLWVINGAKISGTIAAWFRAKYPSLSAGALVSSPLLPTPAAPLISQRIYEKVKSGGKKCRAVFEKIMKNIEDELGDDRKEALVYNIGKGVQLTPDEVLYFYQQRIDVIPKEAFIFVCQRSTENQLLDSWRQIVASNELFNYDPFSLSQRAMASVDDWRYFEVVRTARANWYLRCTQVGLFEIHPTGKSFTSSRISEQFFRERCKTIFGAALWPDPTALLSQNKALMNSVGNLLIIHGHYDTSLPYGLMSNSSFSKVIIKQCLKCEGTFDYIKYHIKYDRVEDTFEEERNALDKWLGS